MSDRLPSSEPDESPLDENALKVVSQVFRSPASTDVTRVNVFKRRESVNSDLSVLEPSPKRFNVCDEDDRLSSGNIEDAVVPQDAGSFPRFNHCNFLPDDIARFHRTRTDSMDNDIDSSDSEMTRSPGIPENDDSNSASSEDSDSNIVPPDPIPKTPMVRRIVAPLLTEGTPPMSVAFTPYAHQKQDEYIEDWNYNVAAGEIKYTLKGVSAFRRTQENTNYYSRYFYMRGVPFRIMLLPRDTGMVGDKTATGCVRSRYIGFFVQCNPVRNGKWNFRGSVNLRMVSHIPGREDHSRKIVHSFHPGENDWGFAQFYNCDQFDEPGNQFVHDDQIDFHVVIHVDPPKLNTWMLPPVNQKLAGHTGIRNLGSTCYFNSLLQMLYGINKLRKIIYEYDSSGDSENDTLVFELQAMFFLMQYADYPVDTINLGKLLWTDTISQEDVHDMFMKLVDRVCTAVHAKYPNEELTELFENITRRSIRCTDIDFQKVLSEEKMNCVLLSVRVGERAFETLGESLNDYVSISRLDGDNCYDTVEHGLQAAEMSTKFSKFAPVVVLTLQRSTYENFQMKLNDVFAYEEKLNLVPFVDDVTEFDPRNGDYSLYSVVVHYGESGCGHYVCYINTNMKGKHRWIKCDDESIYRCADHEAINNNFGVLENAKDSDVGTAYVLTYIRNNMIDEVMCDVDIDTLNPTIRPRIQERFVQQHLNHVMRTETTYSHPLLLVTEQLLQTSMYERFDLIDIRNLKEHYPRIFLPKDIFPCDVYHEIRKQVSYLADKDFRIYLFRYADIANPINRHYKGGVRPCHLIPPEGKMELTLFSENAVSYAIYIHITQCGPMITEFLEPPDQDLVFVKLYHNNRSLVMGTIFVAPMQRLFDKLPEIRQVCRLPGNVKIRVYTEVCPFDVRMIEEDFVVDPHNGFDGNGSIIVVEVVDALNVNEPQFPIFWKNLSRGITLTLDMDTELYPANCIRHANQKHIINCYIDTPLKEIAERLAATVYAGVVPRENILIWRGVSIFDKPFINFYEQMNVNTVGDLLGIRTDMFDGRERYEFSLRFIVLTFPIAKDQPYVLTPAYLLSPEYRLISSRTVFSPKWTLGEMCSYIAPNYPFSPNGTHKLRVVVTFKCGQGKAVNAVHCRAYRVMDDKMTCEALIKATTDRVMSIRIEEIPVGQVLSEDEEVRKKEALTAVVSFQTSILMLYDTSFFVKINDGEKFGAVRERIRGLMKLMEGDNFDHFKFFLYAGINPKMALNDLTVIDFSVWVNHTCPPQEQPYIAIKRQIPMELELLKLTQ